MMKVYAQGGKTSGRFGNSQNRKSINPKAENARFERPASERRRGPESQGAYMRRTGGSVWGTIER